LSGHIQMDDHRPINVNSYDSDQGKLRASLKWLVTHIYSDSVPDMLETFFVENHGELALNSAIATALINGSLYSQAASKILKDNALVNQTHGGVLRALSSAHIQVKDADGRIVTEDDLTSFDPFDKNAHIALMDALMEAHVQSIISIDRVVKAVSEYTSVDKREEPLDRVDALLFWINKICLLVRDDVEKSGMRLNSNDLDTTIPEMEDLYEDLCDGMCICALIAFYRPHDVHLQDVFFNDRSSLPDCRFNLSILKNFCSTCLPWNPFHFELEDILYLHESFKPNVDAFLADLFSFFEPLAEPQVPAALSPTQRRFVPIAGIPDLRAQNMASRPVHPPRVKNYTTSQRDRSISMASMDSLMTTRTADSLRYNPVPLSNLPPNAQTTNFSALQPDSTHYAEPIAADRTNRADVKSTAEARLLMEERRREYERNRLAKSSMKEEERQKAGKDAFFKIMSKSANENDFSSKSSEESREVTQEMATAREELLSQQVQNLQEQINTLKLSSPAFGGSTQHISHAISHPSIHNELLYAAQQNAGLPNASQFVGGTLPRGPLGGRPPIPPPQHDINASLSNTQLQYAGYDTSPQGNAFAPNAYPQQGHYAMTSNGYPRAAFSGAIPQQFTPDTAYNPQAMYSSQQPPMLPNSPQQIHPLQPSTSQPSALHLLHQQQQTPNRNSAFLPQSGMQYSSHYGQQQQQMSQQEVHGYGIYDHQQSMYPSGGNGVLPPAGMMSQPPHQLNAFDEFPTGPGSVPNANAFRLHQPNASSSRLDPALELNRNLTNWGLTYRISDKPQRRTWTTVNNEDNNGQQPTDYEHSSRIFHNNRLESDRFDESHQSVTNINEHAGLADPNAHQNSPPKDPDFRSSHPAQNGTSKSFNIAPSSVVVEDVTASSPKTVSSTN
jgi:hypothetical protein